MREARGTIKLQSFAATAAKASLVAAVFSLVLPTAWLSLFLIPTIGSWFLSGQFRNRWARIRINPAALAALGLFMLYGVGTLYSPASADDALAGWGKYHKLLYIPLAVSLLDDAGWRHRAIDAFFWGMLLVLALSYLKWLGVVPHTDIGQGYFVFKGRIAHNIFMAFFVFLVLERAASDRPRRWLWAGIALLAAGNVLFLVNGRTGQVILPVLLLLFIDRQWGRRALIGTVAAGVVAMTSVLTIPPLREELQELRLLQIQQELQDHQSTGPVQTSSGQRMEFYRGAVALISEHPVFGWGTGSFKSAYAHYAARNELTNPHVPNPHNEYFLTTQQLGLVGLAALLLMIFLVWQTSKKIDSIDSGALQALVLTITVGSLFNSLLLDAGEGKFFCLLSGAYLSGLRAART